MAALAADDDPESAPDAADEEEEEDDEAAAADEDDPAPAAEAATGTAGLVATTGMVGAAAGNIGMVNIGGIAMAGVMKFEVKTGFVDIEYGVSIVGDCMIEYGELTLGDTLMVGITLTGAGLGPDEAEAAAAPAERLRRPPMMFPVCTLCWLKYDGHCEACTEAAVPIGAVADVMTGFVTTGTCETARSAPDMPVTSEDVADVSTPGEPMFGWKLVPVTDVLDMVRLRRAPAAAAPAAPPPPEAAPAAA